MESKQPLEIPYNKPVIVGKELYYIAQAVIENRHLSGDGPFTHKCNKWLERRLGCGKVLLTHSGTAALEMAALLIDMPPGGEIIMPSFTFVSTANAFVLRGGTPVFVDIRADTLNIDENLIANAITDQTKAIVVVHYAGIACAMDEILRIARQHSLPVIEDAAQALLSSYNGKYLGTFGQLGCLSFHETKNIISGEGGALLINKEEWQARAEIIREKGTNRSQFLRGEVDKYTWMDIGSSYLPNEITAAFLYAQMERAEVISTRRCQIFERYLQALKTLEDQELLRLPIVPEGCQSNGHIFYLIARSSRERNRLIQFLKEHSIGAIFHYVPLHSSPAGKKYGRVCGSMQVTEDLSSRLVRLPIYFEMRDSQVDKVVELVFDFYARQRSGRAKSHA